MSRRRELAEVTKAARWASHVDVGMTALEQESFWAVCERPRER